MERLQNPSHSSKAVCVYKGYIKLQNKGWRDGSEVKDNLLFLQRTRVRYLGRHKAALNWL